MKVSASFGGAVDFFSDKLLGSSARDDEFRDYDAALDVHNAAQSNNGFKRSTIDKPLPAIPDSPTRFAPDSLLSPAFGYKSLSGTKYGENTQAKYSPDNLCFEIDDNGESPE